MWRTFEPASAASAVGHTTSLSRGKIQEQHAGWSRPLLGACLLDETAESVAWDELPALELGACRGRGVVGLEPLLDGAALVGKAVYLLRVCVWLISRRVG